MAIRRTYPVQHPALGNIVDVPEGTPIDQIDAAFKDMERQAADYSRRQQQEQLVSGLGGMIRDATSYQQQYPTISNAAAMAMTPAALQQTMNAQQGVLDRNNEMAWRQQQAALASEQRRRETDAAQMNKRFDRVLTVAEARQRAQEARRRAALENEQIRMQQQRLAEEIRQSRMPKISVDSRTGMAISIDPTTNQVTSYGIPAIQSANAALRQDELQKSLAIAAAGRAPRETYEYKDAQGNTHKALPNNKGVIIGPDGVFMGWEDLTPNENGQQVRPSVITMADGTKVSALQQADGTWKQVEIPGVGQGQNADPITSAIERSLPENLWRDRNSVIPVLNAEIQAGRIDPGVAKAYVDELPGVNWIFTEPNVTAQQQPAVVPQQQQQAVPVAQTAPQQVSQAPRRAAYQGKSGVVVGDMFYTDEEWAALQSQKGSK